MIMAMMTISCYGNDDDDVYDNDYGDGKGDDNDDDITLLQ